MFSDVMIALKLPFPCKIKKGLNLKLQGKLKLRCFRELSELSKRSQKKFEPLRRSPIKD
jgi:hypothetical protein